MIDVQMATCTAGLHLSIAGPAAGGALSAAAEQCASTTL